MWYTLQTSPNYEAKVTQGIMKKVSDLALPIREVFSPEELVVDFKDGKKKERKKRLYTNYLFLEMDYSDEVWHALKGIKGVVGFIGSKGKPSVLLEQDILAMKDKVSSGEAKPKISFEKGSKVRIVSGSFADFYGIVKSVEYDKNKARVAINIFNRETEVDLELTLLELSK